MPKFGNFIQYKASAPSSRNRKDSECKWNLYVWLQTKVKSLSKQFKEFDNFWSTTNAFSKNG